MRPEAASWKGIALGLTVASSFAAGSALARLAYDNGSDPLSVLTVRTGVALIALWLLLGWQGMPRRLGRRRRLAALALGALLGVYSYGLLGSIAYMPVALAVVTFYTYPLLVALGSRFAGGEPVRAGTFVAMAVAFGGLALALGIEPGAFSPTGAALALGAAAVFAAMLLLNDRLRGGEDSRPITLHMLAAAFAGYTALCVLGGHFALPQSPTGWAALLGVPVFYSFSIITLFVVVHMTGPVRSALLMNVEPVASALFGALLLEQILTPLQLLGFSVVLGAVVWVRLAELRRARG